MAVLRAALCLFLVFSMLELVLVSATPLAMNQTVMEAIQNNNLMAVFNTTNLECDVSLLRIVQALTNTTNSLKSTAGALNVSVDLLKSGCLDFTLLEMAGLLEEPPQGFLKTATFDKVVKKVCESNSTAPTKARLENVMRSFEKKGIPTNVTVTALVERRRLKENDTGSFTVLQLVQTALNFTERELIESGLLNVSSHHLGFLNHTLDELACIVGVPKEKLRSFTLAQLLSVTYAFRPLMNRIKNLVEIRRNSTLLQMANNDSDALSNMTLLQLAVGNLPEYFATFILDVPCQQANQSIYSYTIDRLSQLTNKNVTELQHYQFNTFRSYILSIKVFLLSEMEAMREKKEEVIKLSEVYGVTLIELLEAQNKSIREVLSMNLFEINNLLCYNSLYRYSKKSGKSLSELAATLGVTFKQMQKAPFNTCRTYLSALIVEDVKNTFGYPAATTDRLLSCNLAPAHQVSFIDRCDLMKRHSLSFTLEMHGKLTIPVYGKTVLEIATFIGLSQSDLLACNYGIRNSHLPKLNAYNLTRIAVELEMDRYTIFSKSFQWIIQKVINDTDECKRRIDRCQPWSTCTNTLLSYYCECPSTGRYLEPYCEDVDECSTKAFPYNCHDGRQFCHNIPGSFYCGGCFKGYQKVNETYCEDEDECADNFKNTCFWSKERCINTIGSYECACGHGLRRITPKRCVDINECDLQPAVCGHIPNALCNNRYGGYSCYCPNGFNKVQNGTSFQNCTDIDECTIEPGICRKEHEQCKNLPGRYTCVCKEGYERHRGKCQEKRPHFTINFGLAFFLRWRHSFAEVQVPGGLPYCGELYDKLVIHTNGLISIGSHYSRRNPKRFDRLSQNVLAPFWANSDIPHGASVAYQVLDRSDKDQAETMNKASQLISDTENLDSSFNATWVLIVSWQNVSPYARFLRFSWFVWFWYNPYIAEKNTFKAVVATNGTHSYAVFLYEDMDWYRTYLRRRAAVGFASKDSSCKYQVPGSFENRIFNIDAVKFEDKSGKERRGLITLSLNSDKIPEQTDLQRCVGWYEEEPEPDWAEDLPQCPCDEMAARYNPEFSFVSMNFRLQVTYELTFPAGDPAQYGQRCVYQRFFFWSSGSLVVGSNNRGSAQRYHPSMRDEHKFYDQQPYNWCCASRTTDNRFCYLYYKKRPCSDCGQSRPPTTIFHWFGNRRRFRFRNRRPRPRPFFGFLFGDPHITTLDGVKYTFNGLGDYVLIAVNNTYAFHGRTRRPKTPDGPANATIFSGFAISQAGGDTVQVHFSVDKPDNMSITVVSSPNCSHYDLSDLESAKTFNKISVRKVSHKNKTLRVSAACGISVDISPGLLGMLNLALIVPESMNNRTQGLMGKMNGDKSDDYAYRNGSILTVVNATESQQEIFDMGQSWKVQDSERLFVNSTCAKEDVFFNTSFKPAFFSWDSLGDLRDNATRICGTSNLECLFDIAQTRNVAVGEETIGFEKESNKIKEALDNLPPVIHGPASVKAECGKTVEFQVSATDPNNDTLSYMVSGLPASATFNNNTATITWNVTNAKNVSIIVIVTDKLGASTQQAITVNLCCCQNNGECLFNQTVIGKGTENFQFMKCNCTALYDGDLCENGRDPCVDKPCYDDSVSCNKNQSYDKGYTCSACPEGLTGNGEDCVVMDKCASNNGGCGQICNNSLGPVTCNCRPGFKLNDDGKNCTDIDECDIITGSNDCAASATCTNGPGNYSCECRKGFEGNPKTNCTDIDECNNGVAQCSHECKNLPGTFKCSCRKGFQLANDNTTCEDIDECKFAITNKCQMKCINLFSTYNCSCPAGFQLNSDHQTCTVAPSSKCNSINGGCVNGLCSNSSGNITCHCTSGFNLTADGKTCEDVDECQRSNGECSQTCTNLRGGYNCSCRPGFTLLHDKRTCQDIDECKSKPCSTDAKCTNRQGSYNCKCNAGYSGDGKTCSNINECEESSSCSKDKTCTDLIGSYSCSCPPKQADLGSGCERIKQFYLSCRFLTVVWRSEYLDTTSAEYEKLARTIVAETDNFGRKWFKDIYRGCKVRNLWQGSVRANISLLFNSTANVSASDLTNTMRNVNEFGNLAVDPSAALITDPNECSDPQSNNCHAEATCFNTQGSYDCKCNAGYEGDGLICELEPEVTEKKEKDNRKLILAIVIPLVCVLLLIIILCACTYYQRNKNRKEMFTTDEEHEYIHKHKLSERGAGRPITSNEYVLGERDKNSRKVSASSEESGPMYDNPDAAGSHDVSRGAYANPALGDASLPMYENPAATGSYDMSQGAYVNVDGAEADTAM